MWLSCEFYITFTLRIKIFKLIPVDNECYAIKLSNNFYNVQIYSGQIVQHRRGNIDEFNSESETKAKENPPAQKELPIFM